MAFVDGLRSDLGAAGVLTGADAAPYLTDQKGQFTGEALAVVRPASVDETVLVVRACASVGVAIVPQGGNTGMSGGAVPTDTDSAEGTERPSIVLSMSRMNRIVSVDPDRWTITAEAGAPIEAVQQAAAAANRLFGPDWGARGTATVGGAISTDAGGNNVVRYGFGHVGDGNLHMYVLPISDDQVEPFLAVRDELRQRIDEATFALGGTLSAEHGIGQLLRDRIGPQKPAIEWDLMRAVKNALDPRGIMNPHKTLPSLLKQA